MLIMRYFVCPILNLIIRRDKRIYLFYPGNPSRFCDNTKYLYLFLSQHGELGLKAIWIGKNPLIVNRLKERGYLAYLDSDIVSYYYRIKAKYFISDQWHNYKYFLSFGSKYIHLWHGIPLKKIGFDDKYDKRKFLSKSNIFRKFIFKHICKEAYMFCCSDYDKEIFHTAFKLDRDRIFTLGYPRNDVLISDISGSDLFIEDELEDLKERKKSGKNLILYVPTFRDSGRDPFDIINEHLSELKEFLKENNALLILKPHPVSKISGFQSDKNIHILNGTFDLNPLLSQIDILITDYSSVYLDFLFVNRPTVFFPFDIDTYLSEDRAMYIEYDEYTPGEKVISIEQLIVAIKKILDNGDMYSDKRLELRKKIFKYEENLSSFRIVSKIMEFD